MKKENSTNSFILQEKIYIKEDQELIKCSEDYLSILKKRFGIYSSNYRLKNVINAATDLIQFEKELLKSRKKNVKQLISKLK